MAKISIVQGTTSKLVDIFIQDSTSTSGAGLTGLAYNTASLKAYYYREGAATSTSISLATMTLGTWATSGFVVVDGTNMPGAYQLGIPNAALASGAKSVVVMLSGAANMVPLLLEIELTAIDNQDAVRGGMTALPNANAAAAGGLPTSSTGYIVLKKNTAFNNIAMYMVSSTDHVTPVTGAIVTCQRSLDGGSFANCATATATEIAFGWYVVNLANTDTNCNSGIFRATATGADAYSFPFIPQP